MKKNLIITSVKTLLIIFSVLLIRSLQSDSINDTLSKVYTSSPLLKSQRFELEALNEDLAKALSNKRPKVNLYGTIGADKTKTVSTSKIESTKNNNPKSISLEISQNIYDSGKNSFNISKTDALIFAQRAELMKEEQKVLLEAVHIYLNLLAAYEINKLARKNSDVLKQNLEATKSRFQVGEATSTDLSLAKARYMSGKSDEIRSIGNVEKEKSKYFSMIGEEAPKKLFFPKENFSIPNSLKSIINATIKNNPEIIANGFKKKSSYFDISMAITDLLPKLDLNLSAQNAWAPNTFFEEYENYKLELSLKVPLYQGGNNYSNIRKKKKEAIQIGELLNYTIKKLIKEAELLWIELKSLESQIKSVSATINANQLALEGVKKEAEVGTRTLLDILDAEQEVLEERVELIKARKDKFYTLYSLMEKIGKLNPSDLQLSVKNYNYDKSYNSVKKMWLGFEDN